MDQNPDDKTAPAGLAERWLSRHLYRYRAMDQAGYRAFSWVFAITLGLLLATGTVWLARPYYRHHKEKRAAVLSQLFLKKGDENNARIRALQALALNPENRMASRVMAQLATAAHSPAELEWWQKVAQAEPTPENKMILAEAALKWQRPPFALAARILDELAVTEVNTPRYQALAAELAMDQRQLGEADEHWTAAARLDPTNVDYAVNLAVLGLGLTNEAGRAEARVRLQTLRTDSIYGPAALRALIIDRMLQKDFTHAHDYSTQLLASPNASLRDRLQNLDILHALKSRDLTGRLQALCQSEDTNGSAVADISAWMLANGRLVEDRQWLEGLPLVKNQQPVELSLAGVYEQGENWQSLFDYTSHGNWDDLDYLRLAAAAHAAAQLKIPPVARANWDSAVGEATGNLNDLRRLLGLAIQWRMKPEGEDLLERIIQDFPGEQPAVLALTRVYFSAGNTTAIYELYTRLSTLYPTNTEYQLNVAVTSLLLQTNVPEASQWLAAAYARTPGNPQVTSMYAYALHLRHQDAAGIAAMAKLPPTDLTQGSPALYYGLLLASAGKPGEAAKWLHLAQGKDDRLMPEEKQLLESALKGR